MRTCVECGAVAVWQHPTDHAWLCENHAPRDRAICVVEGCLRPAAARHSDSHKWLCAEHMSKAAS